MCARRVRGGRLFRPVGVWEAIQLSVHTTTMSKDVVVCSVVSKDKSGVPRERGDHLFRHSQHICDNHILCFSLGCALQTCVIVLRQGSLYTLTASENGIVCV